MYLNDSIRDNMLVVTNTMVNPNFPISFLAKYMDDTNISKINI